MSEKKPIPPASPTKGKVCPVCGQATYSRSGIHPQCAVQQADAPRVEKLKATRKRESEGTKQPAWSKKCPKCGRSPHVRRKVCDCGYVFE